jgi:Arc/MetJ-type ribon-helix-helix transcriptional regulator
VRLRVSIDKWIPEPLESSILAAVASGQYASVDEAMAEAARLLLRAIKQ